MKNKRFVAYIAALLVATASFVGCSDTSTASTTSTSVTTSDVDSASADAEDTETTSYWSVPLSETSRVDSYAWYADSDKYTRNEIVHNGIAFIRTTFEDMFIIKTNIGYLEDITTETSPFTVVKEVGADGGAEFGYYLAIIPRTDIGSYIDDTGDIVYTINAYEGTEAEDDSEYHTYDEYEDMYSVGYTVRLVDINDNVLNQDWETIYGLVVFSEDNAYMGDARTQYLSWHTEGDIPIENIAYVEFNFVGILSEDCTIGRPILDYHIKVRNPYVKS